MENISAAIRMSFHKDGQEKYCPDSNTFFFLKIFYIFVCAYFWKSRGQVVQANSCHVGNVTCLEIVLSSSGHEAP